MVFPCAGKMQFPFPKRCRLRFPRIAVKRHRIIHRSDCVLFCSSFIISILPALLRVMNMVTAMAMERILVVFFSVLLVLSQVSASTVPAFLWSPQSSNNGLKDTVNYQIMSPKDLLNSVLSEGGWSNLLCSGEKLQQPVNLAIVFVGRELHSSDLAGNKRVDPALVDLLKDSFTKSNFSMAFPYVTPSEEETMENLLISGFTEACGQDLASINIAFSDSCSIQRGDFQRLADLHSVHDHLVSRTEKRTKGQTDLVVFCQGGFHSLNEVDQTRPESEIMSEVINTVEQSGANYAALYVSDPFRSISYPSYWELERFLAEGVGGNGSTNSTGCDEVCQIKSSLLEGVLVGIVLLLILISGLCCMMGIDTPTRFEAPQDS